MNKSHPRDWENPGRVRVQWKKDGRLVNSAIKSSTFLYLFFFNRSHTHKILTTEKQLLETICFQIQKLKPENVPKPPYTLAAPKDASPPVSKSAGGNNSASTPASTQSITSKGKQSTNLSKSKQLSNISNQVNLPTLKGGRRLPIPPEPLPPLTNRVSTYSPAISTGILVEAVKAGMNNPEQGSLPGGGGGGGGSAANIPKGKRKVVRVRG